METLRFAAELEVKNAEKGEVVATIATIGVVDRDGDVVTPGAVRNGAPVKMSSFGHDIVLGSHAPVGSGEIVEDGTRLVFKGRIFLSTTRGRETFLTLRELGADCEWSFGFRVLQSQTPERAWAEKGASRILTKLEAFEVSPVLMGAGIGTGTTQLKRALPEDEAAKVQRLVASARRMLQASERILGDSDAKALQEVDVDPLLAIEADELARWGAARWSLPETPRVKFFDPEQRPQSRGSFFYSDPGSIWISAALRGEQLKETILHETTHLARHYHELPQDEGEVDAEAKALAHHHNHETEATRKWADYEY